MEKAPRLIPAVPVVGPEVPIQPRPFSADNTNYAAGMDSGSQFTSANGPFLMPSPPNMNLVDPARTYMTPQESIEWNALIQQGATAGNEGIERWTVPAREGAIADASVNGKTPFGVNADWVRGGTFAIRGDLDADARPKIAPAMFGQTTARLQREPITYVVNNTPFEPNPDQDIVDNAWRYMHGKQREPVTRQPLFRFHPALWEGFTNQKDEELSMWTNIGGIIALFLAFWIVTKVLCRQK